MFLRRSLLNLCLAIFILIAIFSLVNPQENPYLFTLLCLICMAAYLNMDRIFLVAIGAREISEVEYDWVCQIVRNRAFLAGVNYPSVYTYKGNFKRIYILTTGKRTTIVIDCKLIREIKKEELKGFVESSFAQSKGFKINKMHYLFYLALASLLINVIYKLIRLLGVSTKIREGITLPFSIAIYSTVYLIKKILLPEDYLDKIKDPYIVSSLERFQANQSGLYIGLKKILSASYSDRGKDGCIMGIEANL